MARIDTFPQLPRTSRARIWTSAMGAFSFSLGAGGIGLSIIAIGSPGGMLLGASGLVVGTTLTVLGAWMHSLVTLLAPRDTLRSIRPISVGLAIACLISGLVGMLGSSLGLAMLDVTAALTSTDGLRRVLTAGGALLAGSGLTLSGGLNLTVLGLDSVNRR